MLDYRHKTELFFDFNKQCNIGGWQNNCALNCVTHFFAHKLALGELQKTFAYDPEYQDLLQSFQEYYHLNTKPTWTDIADLFNRYPIPTDREVLFAPVLRHHLGKVLLRKAAEIWESVVAGALTDYVTLQPVRDSAIPFVQACSAGFNFFRDQYQLSLQEMNIRPVTQQEQERALNQLIYGNLITSPTQKQVTDQILFSRRKECLDRIQKDAELFWITDGITQYAQRIANLETAEMVDYFQLSWLNRAFQIGTVIYTIDGLQAAPVKKDYKWLMQIFNSGAHWTLEHPETDPELCAVYVAEHNHYYSHIDLDRYTQFQFEAPIQVEAFFSERAAIKGVPAISAGKVPASVPAPAVKPVQPAVVLNPAKPTVSTVPLQSSVPNPDVLQPVKAKEPSIPTVPSLPSVPNAVVLKPVKPFEVANAQVVKPKQSVVEKPVELAKPILHAAPAALKPATTVVVATPAPAKPKQSDPVPATASSQGVVLKKTGLVTSTVKGNTAVAMVETTGESIADVRSRLKKVNTSLRSS